MFSQEGAPGVKTMGQYRQWRTQEFCSRGVQQIQLRTDGTENGDLGAAAP
jgi:hypothetical protein